MGWLFSSRILALLTEALFSDSREATITFMLWELHWLCIAFWAQFKVRVLIYKALYSLGPEYLKCHYHEHSLCSAEEEGVFCVVPTSVARLVVTRRGSIFLVVAPLLCNSFPNKALLVLSLITFRHIVKMELFRWVFI